MAKGPKKNARPLRVRNQCQPPLILPTVTVVGAQSIQLAWPVPMQVGGIPQVKYAGLTPPDTMTIEGTASIQLDYPDAFEPDQEFSLAPWDGAVRTSQGGYLAPFKVTP